MAQGTRTFLLVIFLFGLGGGILWVGGAELAGLAQALNRRAPFVSVGRGPVYGVVAGIALLLLGVVILAVDVLRLGAGPKLIRAIGIGLVAAVVALVVVPFVFSELSEKHLQVMGYRRCAASSHGRWTSNRWVAPGRLCAEAPASGGGS